MEAEVKTLFDEQAKTFEAFKKANDEVQASVKKLGEDAVKKDELKKLDDALDKIGEQIKAATKRNDDIEAKMNRMDLSGGDSKATVEIEAEVKSHNLILSAASSDRRAQFSPLDAKGYGEYKAAQSKFLRFGRDGMTPDEVKTMSVGSDPDGGYWVTPDIGGQIVKKVYETSEVRQYASVQTIGTDALEGMEDLGEAGAGYAGEHTQGSDTTTPQIGKWRIDVFIIDTEPKATQKLLDDASVNVEAWLAAKVADKFARFENSEFITGAAAKIRGFISGYTAATDSGSGVTWGTIGKIGTGVNADFAATSPADKIFDLIGLLKNAYLPNAKFFTRRSVKTKMRKFQDANKQYLFQPSLVLGTPETFGGYPIVQMEDIPALANGSLSLAFGDLKQAYQIVDRQGIRVLRDPYTAKPYVKFYTTKRTGGGVVNFEAIKLLQFS
jgi:HK97 family phage major capsid protein